MAKLFSLSEIIRFELNHPNMQMTASQKEKTDAPAPSRGRADLTLDTSALWKTALQFDSAQSKQDNRD